MSPLLYFIADKRPNDKSKRTRYDDADSMMKYNSNHQKLWENFTKAKIWLLMKTTWAHTYICGM